MEEKIKKALLKIKEKYHLDGFIVEIVEGNGASISGNLIKIGKNNPLEFIECIILHECYHAILQINQTNDFLEKDKGNITPYIQTKIRIWNKIKEDFPELKEKIDFIQSSVGHTIR